MLLVRDENVLLAMKRRGFRAGKYNGVGGKKNAHETIEAAAKREALEEIGVVIEDLEQVVTLNFYFPYNKDWAQRVTVFMVTRWNGEPQESEEMTPQWFAKLNMPLEKMWPDEKQWPPLVFDGKKVAGEFMFNKKEEIIDQQLRVV